MKIGFLFAGGALLAQCSARYIAERAPLPSESAGDLETSATFNATEEVTLMGRDVLGHTPDCTRLGHQPRDDPKWDFDSADQAECVCYSKRWLLHCDVTIPNDHIFDKDNMRNEPTECGRSVYWAVNRWLSWKSGHSCRLDRNNVAHLHWVNAIGVGMKRIQEGWDKGTCGAYSNVKCVKAK